MSNKKRWVAMKCQKQDDKNLMISGIARPWWSGRPLFLFMSSPEKVVKLRDGEISRYLFPTFFSNQRDETLHRGRSLQIIILLPSTYKARCPLWLHLEEGGVERERPLLASNMNGALTMNVDKDSSSSEVELRPAASGGNNESPPAGVCRPA